VTSNEPLSARNYIEPSCFEQEKQNIFYRGWHCVGHCSEFSNPGDFASYAIVDENVFVVRDAAGVLRSFYNVCRHRGHPLVEGVGNVKHTLVCPYHAWAYDLDGSLRHIPSAGEADNVRCADLALRPVRLEEYAGFIFVNLDDHAAAIGPQLTGLEGALRSFYPELERLRFVCETAIEHQCNWKISVENYNECYHCPTVHSSSLTRGVLAMSGYTIQPAGQMIWHEGKAQTANEKQYDYDLTHSQRAGDYAAYWIWPTLSLCCYPGGFFTIRQWLPVNYRKTIYRYRWFSDGRLTDDEVEALMLKHKETTGSEDEHVVAKIQKSMESRAFEPGPYILGDGRGAMSEVGVRHFHDLYRSTMFGDSPVAERGMKP
jgi:phenylpropionate dioxygenase-like ring-hydroxylating dioxygenase large terminal subunit